MTAKIWKDHYATLGIPDKATIKEINKAYREKSLQFHPDKNPGISQDMMKDLNEARNTLVDPSKRRDYDRDRREKMRQRGEGVSKGRAHKEKDKKTPPGTFFKSKGAQNKGAAESAYSEFKNFTQGAKDNKGTPNFKEHAQSSRFNFSFGQETKDKKETPNFGDNTRSTQYNFSFSNDAKDTKDDPNFAGGAKKRKYDFFSSQDTKDKEETPNFAGNAQSNGNQFSSGPKAKDKAESPNFGGNTRSTQYNFSFSRDAQDTKDDPNFAGGSNTDEPLVREVFLTLEDVATGCIKDMHFSRPMKLEDGTMGKEKMVLSFEVKKGWKAGSKVTFGKAAQTWKNADRDIVFIMRDAPHSIFTRDGSDLLYTANVSAAQVELGSPIDIPTLHGGKKSLIITPDFVDDPNLLKRIKGEGLPFPKEPTKRGDLIVKFVSLS